MDEFSNRVGTLGSPKYRNACVFENVLVQAFWNCFRQYLMNSVVCKEWQELQNSRIFLSDCCMYLLFRLGHFLCPAYKVSVARMLSGSCGVYIMSCTWIGV
jgi:hypothetical protein